MYNNDIMERFLDPKFAGALRGASAVGTAKSEDGNEVIKLYLSLTDDAVVKDAKFKAFGGPIVIAVSDALAQMTIGLTLRELEEFNEARIMKMFNNFPQERFYIIMLAIDVLNNAIDDYYKRLRKLEKKRQAEIKNTNFVNNDNSNFDDNNALELDEIEIDDFED